MLVRRRYGSLLCLLLALTTWPAASAQAALVTQLDFTHGSIGLMNGSTTVLSASFAQNGTIVMGQYQPLPNIIPPISLGPYTFSLFTGGPDPFPSSSTSGGTIAADLTSLSAGVTGPLLPPSPGLAMNIGGHAAGSFNPSTNAFTNLSWSHVLSGSGLPAGWGGLSLIVNLNGTAQLAAIPLPGAVLLFVTGLSGVVAARRRRLSLA